MYGHSPSRNRKLFVATAIVISAAALIAPRSWTGGLISAVQVLVPFQDAAGLAADTASGAVSSSSAPIPGHVHDALEREKSALQHHVAALTERITRLEQENAILTGIRLRDFDSSRIGVRGRLLPARIVADDMLPWRDSALVNVGTLRGVRVGAPVTSRGLLLDRGREDGLRDGMAVLLSETLIGLVDENLGTHTARVRLLSDVTAKMRVRIGRFADDAFVLADQDFLLIGRGKGRMEIHDVDRRDVQSNIVQIGDLVLADPSDGAIPAALTIGKISAIKPDHENPLLSILIVESPTSRHSLRRVFVYDPTGSNDE